MVRKVACIVAAVALDLGGGPALAQAAAPPVIAMPLPAVVGPAMVLPAPSLPAVPVALPAPAVRIAAPAWTGDELAAARLRSLQTLLMVGTLRCHAMGIDIAADYDRFVNAARGALVSANDRLKARFAQVYGAADGQERFDRFATSIANAHGGDGTSKAVCARLGAAARLAAADAQSPGRLLMLADLEDVADGLPAMGPAAVQVASR